MPITEQIAGRDFASDSRSWIAVVRKCIEGFFMELKPGMDFRGYRLVRLLGKGGFGSVYEAVKEGDGNVPGVRAALKVLHPAHAKDEKTVHRFHREARLAQKLTHPATVKILDSGTYEGIHFILMEYVEGRTLLEFMKSPPREIPSASDVSTPTRTSVKDEKTLSLQEIPTLRMEKADTEEETVAFMRPPVPPKDLTLSLIRQCAEALDAASGAGLIHRDIKPENILIQDMKGEFRVKILDFGLAKNLVDQSMQLSMDGQAMGTPAYMSPEQWKGEAIDTRADLYSLGASFYTFVTGEKAFASSSMKDLMRQILVEKTRRADELRPSVDKDIADLLEKMMMKDPRDRFQTPLELIRRIDEIGSQTKMISATEWGTPEKKSRTGIFLILIFLLLVAGGGFLFMRSKTALAPLQDKGIPEAPALKESQVISKAVLSFEKDSVKSESESSPRVISPPPEPEKKLAQDSNKDSYPENPPVFDQGQVSPSLQREVPAVSSQKVVSGFSDDLKGEIQTRESDRLKKLLSQKNIEQNNSQP